MEERLNTRRKRYIYGERAREELSEVGARCLATRELPYEKQCDN